MSTTTDLLKMTRCLNGGGGGDYPRLPHSCWCVCLSVRSYGHICFGFERFVCPSVFVFLPPPSSLTPSVSGGRLRSDQSGFDAVGPCLPFYSTRGWEISNASWAKAVRQSCVEQKVRWDISAFKVQPLSTPWPVRARPTLSLLHPARRLDAPSHMWQTGSARAWRAISHGEGEKTTTASSSAIIRQNSPEEVRNHYPTWSVLPIPKEYSSGRFCKLIRSDLKDSTAGYNPSLSTFNGLFAQQPFYINPGSSL